MVMEHCEHGDLQKYLEGQKTLHKITAVKGVTQGLSLVKVWKFFINLLQALDYLHTKGVIHRDFKPSNIMISKDYTLKIGDFGISHI